MKDLSTIKILVENNAGILTRISSVFSRRGYNIESINVAVNGDGKRSTIIATISEDEDLVRQVVNQIEKLEDVVKLEIMKDENFISREMVIVRLRVEHNDYLELSALTNLYNAHIIDYSSEDLFVEVVGDRDKLNDFLNIISKYEVVDVSRSGLTGIKRK